MVKVFSALSCHKINGPLFFAESSLTGVPHLDMLEHYLMLQVQQDMGAKFIFH